jgi:prophage antirepressor-like protein
LGRIYQEEGLLMGLTFKGAPVELREYKGHSFSMQGFELDNVLWVLLEDAVNILNVSTEVVSELLKEEPEDFGTLSDGRVVIKEGGFNYLALFESNTSEAEEFQEWVFNSVIPSILEKGCYSVEEEKNNHD